MDSIYPIGLAALTAGILTYCDLDSVFDAPPTNLKWRPWFRLCVWWWGFILANALLAGCLYYALNSKQYFKEWNPWVVALLIGGGYTALVRLQFTTLPLNGKNTPVGLETFYEALKSLVHRRINRIIRVWRMEQCEVLAQTDLGTLRERALMMVGSDALMTEEQRNSTRAWIEKIADQGKTPENDRRRILALFIITEQKPSQP